MGGNDTQDMSNGCWGGILLRNWILCCLPFEPWPGCRCRSPLTSRPAAEDGWLRESGFQSQIWGGAGQGSSHRCRAVGLKRTAPAPERIGLRMHAWEGLVISLLSCSFSWISLISLFLSFCSSFCFYLLPSTRADFLFFLVFFPHLSTFLASLACSQFFFSILLPCQFLDKNWSQVAMNWKMNFCHSWTSHVP